MIRSLVNGVLVNLTESQFDTIATLNEVQTRGGFARVYEYHNSEGKVSSFTFNSNFSVLNNYGNQIREIVELGFSQVNIDRVRLSKYFTGKSLDKFFEQSEEEMRNLFESCKGLKVVSMQKTIDGVQDHAVSVGHDRNNIKMGWGKITLVNEKGADGLMYPVLDAEGIVTVKGINVNSLIDYDRNYVVHEEGERKLVNSGLKVVMDKVIEMNLKVRGIQVISLNEGKFKKVVMDGMVVTVGNDLEDMKQIVGDEKTV